MNVSVPEERDQGSALAGGQAHSNPNPIGVARFLRNGVHHNVLKKERYLPISVRTAKSSGKKVSSSAFCKKGAPEDPPVPIFIPMMRCTVRR